jgi:hypothetical protein
MSETTTESAENQPEAGSSAGSGGSPEPTPGAPGQPDAAEVRRRALQSDLDRERARAAQLEKDLAEARASSETSQGLDAASIRSIMAETMRRSAEINSVAEQAKTDYPLANPGLLAKRDEFESPEAFKLALKTSHEEMKAREDAMREKLAAEIREEYGIKLRGSSAGGNENVATQADQLTAAQVASADIHTLREMDDAALKRLAHSLPEPE